MFECIYTDSVPFARDDLAKHENYGVLQCWVDTLRPQWRGGTVDWVILRGAGMLAIWNVWILGRANGTGHGMTGDVHSEP